MSNRRRYFRIDDYVLMDIQPVAPSRRTEITELLRRRQGHRRNIHQVFLSMEKQVSSLIETVSMHNAEVGKVLNMLNSKLNMLEEGMRAEGDVSGDMAMHPVNLSACGMSFGSNEAYAKGDCLQMELVLFPDYITIRLLADVVDAHTAEAGAEYPNQIRVDFEFPHDEDQEMLVQHIMKKQGEELQKNRQED